MSELRRSCCSGSYGSRYLWEPYEHLWSEVVGAGCYAFVDMGRVAHDGHIVLVHAAVAVDVGELVVRVSSGLVDVVGIAHTSLWNVLSKNGKYTTKTATIRLGVLRTKQTNRGRKK